MRVLVLGGTGMLGHKLWQVFSPHFSTFVSLRRSLAACPYSALFDPDRTLEGVTAESFDTVIRAVSRCRPDVVVNAIGIVKQRPEAGDPLTSIAVNASFPHRLADLCAVAGCRLIHISTDCVFSGKTGNYDESDYPDPTDLYGRTKLLGEVDAPGCVTIRTSIIGRELGTAHGLVEWFLSQEHGPVSGYTRAVFSGLTTTALADVLVPIVMVHTQLQGTWHIASEPISKHDLLLLIQSLYRLGTVIHPDDSLQCDRSLNGEQFRNATNITVPAWIDMLEQMYAEQLDGDAYRSCSRLLRQRSTCAVSPGVGVS